jgi:hypothetical protein
MRVPSLSLRGRLPAGVLTGVLAGVLAVTVAACGNGENGGGSDNGAHESSSPSSSPSATTTDAPTGTGSPTPTESPSDTEPTSTPSDCAEGAYCDSFDDPASGWEEEDTPGYVTGYDDYLGGSFRMGIRENASHAATAPASVSALAADYGVRVDVDTTTGPEMPDTGAYGITCWNHPTTDGAGDAAFLLYVDASSAIIGFWDDVSGEYVQVAEEPLSGELRPGQANHLTATCRREGGRARLRLQVNGAEVVTATYGQDGDHRWAVGDGVGLVTAGEGADVFFDDFVLSGG